MFRNLLVLFLVLSLLTGTSTTHAGANLMGGRFSEQQLAAIGKELATAHERLDILNVLMQSDFDKKWILQDLEAVTSKGHYDYSLKARFGSDTIHSGNPNLKYQYMVARVALDRAVDGLSSWVMVDRARQGNLHATLNKPIATTEPVYVAWLGKKVGELNPGEVISQRYPGLTEKIGALGKVIAKADTDLHLQLMAESLILPSVQLVATKDALDRLEVDRKAKEAELTAAASRYDLDYKTKKEHLLKVFKEKLEKIKDTYSCTAAIGEDVARPVKEEETKLFLTPEQITVFDKEALNFELAKIAPCVPDIKSNLDVAYLVMIRDQYLLKANQDIAPSRHVYEQAKENLNTANEQMVQLHVTYNQLLYTEPYFTVLLNTVSRGSEFKDELLYERIAKDHAELQKLEGEARREKFKAVRAYITSALVQEQPKAIARILEYIATVVSGDPAALAPLVEVRQQTLQWITDWKPEYVETYKKADHKFRDDYGFDLQFEKFAALTYFEVYQLLAISLLTGQAKIASLKAMNAVSAFAHYKEEKIKNIEILETQKKQVFEQLENLEKNSANAARHANLKSQLWQIEKQILAAGRSRAWGLGLLTPAAPAWIAAMAIDSAVIGINYYTNKEYRLFARKMIVNASSVGAISYAANVHSKNFTDKDLLYTVAIQAATAFTFTNYSFFRANNAAKALRDFISPSGATTFNMIASAMGRTTLRGLVAAAKSPITVTKGIGSMVANFSVKNLKTFFGDKVMRPIINVIGTVLVATVIDMELRGYDNPITMFKEDEGFRVNLYSFAIIDFLLSYVSEGNNATRAGMANFFISVLGIGLTQYLVKDQHPEDFDVQRLLLEGAYIATYSTAKYKLVFKKSLIYFDNYWHTMFAHLAKSGNRQTARKLTMASKFMLDVVVFAGLSNLAGNAPFLWIVHDLEQVPAEPEGRERFYAEKAYNYVLQLEKEDPRVKYSPADLQEYLEYIRQINQSLKNDIDSIQDVAL